MYFKSCENILFEAYKTKVARLNESEQRSQNEIMDQKTFDDFHLRISRCKYFLAENHPWFGIFLGKLRTVPTYDVNTMGVDDFGNIYINPKFALEKTEKETIGVLAHEVMHVLTLTFFRQNSRDLTLWNIATDYIMNKMLLESGFTLPKDGCIPVKRGNEWFVVLEDDSKKTLGEINITNMHEEKFYDEMVKLLEQNNKEKNNKTGSPSTGPNKVYQTGDRVKSRVTGAKGTVTSVKGLTPGKQQLTIQWD